MCVTRFATLHFMLEQSKNKLQQHDWELPYDFE